MTEHPISDADLAEVYRMYRISVEFQRGDECMRRAYPSNMNEGTLEEYANLSLPCLIWTCDAGDDIHREELLDTLKDQIDLVHLVPFPREKGSNAKWWNEAIATAEAARSEAS
jgi:hypothetical protein